MNTAASTRNTAQVLDTLGTLFVELSIRLAIIQRQANEQAAEAQPPNEQAFAIGHLIEGAGMVADIGAELARSGQSPMPHGLMTWIVGSVIADDIEALNKTGGAA